METGEEKQIMKRIGVIVKRGAVPLQFTMWFTSTAPAEHKAHWVCLVWAALWLLPLVFFFTAWFFKIMSTKLIPETK